MTHLSNHQVPGDPESNIVLEVPGVMTRCRYMLYYHPAPCTCAGELISEAVVDVHTSTSLPSKRRRSPGVCVFPPFALWSTNLNFGNCFYRLVFPVAPGTIVVKTPSQDGMKDIKDPGSTFEERQQHRPTVSVIKNLQLKG